MSRSTDPVSWCTTATTGQRGVRVGAAQQLLSVAQGGLEQGDGLAGAPLPRQLIPSGHPRMIAADRPAT